jgi:outer membrane protein assembly factor BamA
MASPVAWAWPDAGPVRIAPSGGWPCFRALVKRALLGMRKRSVPGAPNGEGWLDDQPQSALHAAIPTIGDLTLMRSSIGLLVLGAGLFAASAAQADQTYLVGKVTITGNKSVPTSQLLAAVQEKPGQRVSVNDIIADRDAISKVLEDAHVQGSVKPSIKTQGAKSEVIFAIEDEGIHAPVVTTVAPKLDQEIFQGNVSLSADQLNAASGLKPGEDLSNEKIAAAQQAIVGAYKAAKLPVSVTINGENKKLDNGTYDIVWHITETKTKKKPRDTEDEGFKTE